MKSLRVLFSGLFISLIIGSPALLADDTEIYTGVDTTKGASNILLVIDTSGSMGWEVANDSSPEDGEPTRLQVVKDVVKDVIIANPDNHNINVGIMRFNPLYYDSNGNPRNSGGRVDSPFIHIGPGSSSTNKTVLNNLIDGLSSGGSTPLEETYYEAYRYMNGLTERFGENGIYAAFENRYSWQTSHSGATYKMPVTHACQKNSIILLTDGRPQLDEQASGLIKSLHDARTTPLADRLSNGVCSQRTEQFYVSGTDSYDDGNCMDELAEIMFENDITDDVGLIGPDGTKITSGDKINVKQNVITHTIGFATTNADVAAILQNTADAGRGISKIATNASDLSDVFNTALNQVIEEASNFTAPALTVNNYNRLTNKEDLYFSLFLPQREPLWPGNIKKYKLKNGKIVDSAGIPAIIDSTGQFSENAVSYWSDPNNPDGNEVKLGGFADRLTTNRLVVSNLTNTADLTSSGNRVNSSNITQSDLGVSSSTDAAAIIDWLRGLDTNGNSNKQIGDTLHTTPLVLSYRTGTTDPTDALFFGTNSGFLHAINVADTVSGNMEHFAFYPEELLTRAENFYKNQSLSTAFSKLYGMDGPISAWIQNDNGNNIVDAGTSEVAHLYATMRRGGNNIYAFNVTNVNKPLLEWTISPSRSGYQELGQTWSQVTQATIPYNNTDGKKDVLIFGGGYDTNQDDAPDTNGDGVITDADDDFRRADSKGRAIYIADAATGNLIWAGVGNSSPNTGNSEVFDAMKYSVPSDITVLDVNGDGLTDRLYFGDMGGQVWRFDIAEKTSTTVGSFEISGGVIADLGADNDEVNNRRFFYAPNVARVSDDTFGAYLSIAIGSGKRSNPKGSYTNDKFYMIKDPYVFTPKADSAGNPVYNYFNSGVITDDGGAIKDITDIANPTQDQVGDYGWSIDFSESGEKVLAAAFTADNKIFFTTYLPDGNVSNNSENLCNPAAALGSGRLYAVSLFNGRAVVKLDPTDATDISNTDIGDLDSLTSEDRFTNLSTPGIASSPQLFISDNSTADSGDVDNDGIINILDVDFTGGTDANNDGIDDALQSQDSDGDGIVDAIDVTNTGGEDKDGNGVDDLYEAGNAGQANCASTTTPTLLVGKAAFKPPICTAPVRTYWHRYDNN